MFQLVADVLDHAPADLTAAEVLLLVALAEDTRTAGEVREIRTDDLCRRARVDPRGLRHVVTRLAKRGIRVRVPIGTDRRGLPLYAVPGRLPRWVLPPFPAPAGCACRTCSAPFPQPVDNPLEGGPVSPPSNKTTAQKGGPLSPPTRQGGPTSPPEGHPRPPEGRTSPPAGRTGPPSPSRSVPVLDQRQRPTLTYLTALTGATDDEARQMIKTLTKRHRPRSIGAYIRGIPDTDLRELLAELRDTASGDPRLPDQCADCGPGRLIELPDGRPARCPTCHPNARRTA